jgi:hypothetical protein
MTSCLGREGGSVGPNVACRTLRWVSEFGVHGGDE